ncbi:MAG: PSD1 and planctomycete cytochrome C domain-containing protein [Gemmataceae bacterium]|nr:PSD1 and planctomycete cytochrome C domain-containing protein [Gemmataceae bacterium]
MRRATFAAGLLLAFPALLLSQPSPPPADPKLLDFFEAKVRPVLAEHCYSCHGPEKQRGDVRLDGRAHLVKPRDDGPIVAPGQPDKSALIRAIRHDGDIKMPPKGKLPAQAIDDLTAWIKLGAVWPADKTAAQDLDAWKKHWAFQRVVKPGAPAVKNQAWARTPVDAFILHKLEGKGLTPSAAAEPRTLLRRLYFDLVGLPPTAEQMDDFVAAWESASAKRQAAVEAVVDRLLSAPQFGERWGRYWLDVARYADSKGYVFQEERRYPYAYTYRDYVVEAFNRDLPFDRFLVEQLAADRLVAQSQAEPKAQAALGYLTLGRRFLNNIHDIIDDRIDVVTRGLMGLTVQCARCHDHKYDPIPTKDYYSLYGVFASSREPRDLPLIGEPAQTAASAVFQKKLAELQATVKKFEADNKKELEARNRKVRNELRALQRKVDAFQASSPAAPPRAMVLHDLPQPVNPRVFGRGKPDNPGPAVPRQFLAVAAGPQRKPFTDGSGRLELAHAIASKDNPLTARVMVNRVWLHLMGAGLVTSPSDFGMRSEPPSHPELLDHLAAQFMEEGWSVKKLIRSIVLSNTYQQESGVRNQESGVRGSAVDPENRLYWRAHRRRLDLESMRDALLAVSGNLDLKAGGPAVDIVKSPYSGRRTLYGFIDRQNLPGLFRTFDFASPDTTSPQRYQTTVPQQALFLLNNPFVQDQARGLLERLEDTADVTEKIQQLHRLAYARPADPEEVRLGEAFLHAAMTNGGQEMTPWERYAQVLLLANEFMFVD